MARPRAGALLLTPGAGADRNQHTLVAVEQGVTPLPCRRVDFPYRLLGKRAPDRAPVAVAHLRGQAAEFVDEVGIPADLLVLGGRSYGGRMCSIAVAEGLPAAGLVLLSYPLHPPGRPEKLRVEHFPQLTVPVLFISGVSDPFGTPDEFDEHVAAIPGPVTQIRLPGGHDPRGADEVIAAVVRDWLGLGGGGEQPPARAARREATPARGTRRASATATKPGVADSTPVARATPTRTTSPGRPNPAVPTAPVPPAPPSRPALAGYSGTPLDRKLGVRPHTRLLLLGAPDGFDLGGVPAHRRPGREPYDVVMLFCPDAAALHRRFAAAAARHTGSGMIWVCWPKKRSGVVTDLTENHVREWGLAHGRVDVKVAAIDQTWSGLKFVIRLADRPG